MEVKDWTYEEFPEYTECPEGATRIPTSGDEVDLWYTPNVEYAEIDGNHLKLQILRPFTRNEMFFPDKYAKKYPIMVFVQGSAWMEQDLYLELPWLGNLARRGYVVALVEYRHSGKASFPAPIQDTKNAIRYMRIHAEEFSGDPDNIILAGCSSGGHTAIFAGIMEDGTEYDRNIYPGVSAKVKGIIDYYGSVSVMMEAGNPNTLNYRLPDSPEGMEFGFVNLREDVELAKKGSAVTHISSDRKYPPTCLIHGTKDFIVNTRQSTELYEKMKECGQDVRLYLIEGAFHGGPEFWMPETLDLVEEFIDHCLK